MKTINFPVFDGELLHRTEDRGCYASDFGGMVRRQPIAVLRPLSIDDIVRAVRFAITQNLPICARGQGHTTRGQSQVEEGLLIDMRSMSRILRLEDGLAHLEAGTLWSTLLSASYRLGLAPPTLTDYTGLTVGGTLSVGGVGSQSFRRGMQTDNVLELTVVTGTGEVKNCSPRQDAELFNAVRGGMGQFGIIVSAKLLMERAPTHTQVGTLEYSELSSLLADQELLANDESLDHLCGFITPTPDRAWSYSLEVARNLPGTPHVAPALDHLRCNAVTQTWREEPYFDYLRRVDALIEVMARDGRWASLHPWFDLFLPASVAQEMIRLVLELISVDELGGGNLMMYPLVRARCQTPFVSLPEEPYLILFDILATVGTSHPERLTRLELACKRIYSEATRRGAKVYPIGYPLGTPLMDWRQQYGPSWEGFLNSKKRFDPASIFGRHIVGQCAE